MSEAETIYASIAGGPELLAWFGCVPSFHDAEIVSLDLRRRAPSKLNIHAWNMRQEVDDRGYFALDRHPVVTFIVEDIIDLQLGGFNIQNVIGGLHIRHAPDRPDRSPFYDGDPSPDDWEIELEPCFGLNGLIRCRKVLVDFVPGDVRE